MSKKKGKERFLRFKVVHVGKPIAEFGFEYCHGCKMRFRCLFKMGDYSKSSVLQLGKLWDVEERMGVSYSEKFYADILPKNKKITKEFRSNFKCVKKVHSYSRPGKGACVGLEDLLIKGHNLFVKRIVDYYGRNG